MNTRSFLLGSLGVGAALAIASKPSTGTTSARRSAGSSSYDVIDAYVEQQMRSLRIPGVSLAIVEGDRIVHLRGFGRARPGGAAPTPRTPFFIGSLTKSFTALAVMQLVEAGKLDLDAPVQRHLPWFRVADAQASRQIAVRHLLNQTSSLPMMLGLADLGDLDDRTGAAERQARALSTLALTRPVGSRFEYSNLNYNLLGLIVEAVSGESYSHYVQQHIFVPLDMRHTFASKAAAERDGLAVGHRYWFGFPVPAPSLPIPIGSLPSGQLISCAEDMAHYLIAQLNDGRYAGRQILSSAGCRAMHSPAAEIHEMGQSFGHYGMGWIIQGRGAWRIVSHSGHVPDFAAFMALVPEQKKGLVILLNVNHAMVKMTFDEIWLGAAQLLAGEPPSPRRFDALPWAMRAMPLVPILQIAGTAGTLRQVRHWRKNPSLRPSRGRLWRRHVLLPLIPNLLPGLFLVPMLSQSRGFFRLFTPDFSWIAAVCGGFSLLWSFLRSWMLLREPKSST
ncbi:MAG TPA: serine hydrolase domain-containing protein [Anaerolineales bacterium]|nr:serine hydrolase domain-containing protein [Anaerolineales bacterium]